MDAPAVRYVTAHTGHSIAYTVSGTGPTFLYMPWTYNNVQSYWKEGTALRRFMEELAKRFRVVHYDGRGQGMSSRGLAEDEPRESYAQEIEAVADRAAPGKFVLFSGPFGHSAIRYAVQHPDRVAALIICHARATMGSINVMSNALIEQDWDVFVETMARTLISFEEPAFAKRLYGESMTREDRIRRARHVAGTNIEDLAPLVTMPRLLMTARAAVWGFGTEEGSGHLASLIPDCRLVLFDDASAGIYAPPGQTPPAVTAIETFLDGLPMPLPLGEPRSGDTGRHALSPREIEVLRLIASGSSNARIGRELVIAPSTVLHHVTSIFAKTGSSNRTEAAAYAFRNGLA